LGILDETVAQTPTVCNRAGRRQFALVSLWAGCSSRIEGYVERRRKPFTRQCALVSLGEEWSVRHRRRCVERRCKSQPIRFTCSPNHPVTEILSSSARPDLENSWGRAKKFSALEVWRAYGESHRRCVERRCKSQPIRFTCSPNHPVTERRSSSARPDLENSWGRAKKFSALEVWRAYGESQGRKLAQGATGGTWGRAKKFSALEVWRAYGESRERKLAQGATGGTTFRLGCREHGPLTGLRRREHSPLFSLRLF